MLKKEKNMKAKNNQFIDINKINKAFRIHEMIINFEVFLDDTLKKYKVSCYQMTMIDLSVTKANGSLSPILRED